MKGFNLSNLTPQTIYSRSVGFDNAVDQMAKMADYVINPKAYPPYNIYKTENGYVIEVAVAGFTKDDLNVEVVKSILTLTGKKEDDVREVIFKGISSKAFTLQWELSENVKVVGSSIKEGLLSLDIEKFVSEEDKPQTIKIS